MNKIKFMTVAVAVIFASLIIITGVQSASAQVNFDDPAGRYAWVLSGGKRVVTSKNIFAQDPWTPEIEKTLTYKSAADWNFTGKEAWNEQGTNAAMTVIYATAQIGCNEQNVCYLQGCYRNTRHNRLHFSVGVVIKEKEIRTEVVVPDIIVMNDNTAIANAIAQINTAPAPVDVCTNIPGNQAVYPPNVIVDVATGDCIPKGVVVEVDSSWCETSRASAVFWGAGAGAGAGAAVGNSKKSRGIGAGVGAGVGALIGGLTENRCYAMIGGGAAGAGAAYWTRHKDRKRDNGGTGGWHPGGGSGGTGCTGRGCL